MNNSQFPYHGEELSRTIVDDSYTVLVRQSVTRAFVWMTLGLAITGLTALFVADSNLIEVIFSGSFPFWILLIAELALVWYLSSRIMKLSMPVATAAFAVYSLLNGVTPLPRPSSSRQVPSLRWLSLVIPPSEICRAWEAI